MFILFFVFLSFGVVIVRFYRGMYYFIDVLFGMLNGLICMFIVRRVLQCV